MGSALEILVAHADAVLLARRGFEVTAVDWSALALNGPIPERRGPGPWSASYWPTSSRSGQRPDCSISSTTAGCITSSARPTAPLLDLLWR